MMKQAYLEYTVSQDGRVTSTNRYHVVDAQQWDNARDVESTRYLMYDSMLRELMLGRILHIPCGSRTRAIHVVSMLRQKAAKQDMCVQTRRVHALDGSEGFDVLARLGTE
jgi:hypothetical protein